ncbi:unnamed protein product [Orchesella dallaii]|uniref:Uncharacterized protein n=1 Tax=Orchesella dallaii TaxID=48710 RepID=A0ABP1RTH6_9HEXA
MDNPISFTSSRVYSVPDTRFTRHGFSLQRPTTVLKPACPITSVNMLPYQVATSGVPYGYTLVPQQVLGPGQRLVPVPGGGRNVYSLVDIDDEEEEYAPPPRRPRSRLLDDEENPEMEAFSATTRQIRKDADAILQRLGSTRPTKSSNFWRTYDYDTRSITPRYLAPPPDRSSLYSRPITPTLDEEPDPFLQSLRPGRRGAGGSRLVTTSLGPERVYTPTSLTAHRVQTLYKELDEPLYAPELKHFDYTACLRQNRAADQEKVRGDVHRRAVLLEPSSGLAEAREKRTSLKLDRLGYDPNSVKSNISIRAQYAAMRAAAGRNLRKPTGLATLSVEPAAPRPSSAASAPST